MFLIVIQLGGQEPVDGAATSPALQPETPRSGEQDMNSAYLRHLRTELILAKHLGHCLAPGKLYVSGEEIGFSWHLMKGLAPAALTGLCPLKERRNPVVTA